MAGLLLAVTVMGGCIPLTDSGDSEAEGEATGTDFLTGILPMLLFIVLLFGLMYFMMIRPQRKRQKEHQDLMEELRRGDKVMTAGGIYGQIESVSDDAVVLKIESGGTIKVARSSVVNKQPESDSYTY